jgi:hypothetical protein
MAIKEKFKIILSRERSLAKTVASAVIKPNPITVWDIMIPIFFFYNLLRFKRSKEIFTLNFLFTKKLALEAAFDIIDKGQIKEEAMTLIEEKTSKILASDKRGVYSEKIRRKQMREIDLLIDHYLKLLKADGKDYASLVKNAYHGEDDYSAFMEKLKQAEKEVNKAARQIVRTQTAIDMLSTMENALERSRMAEFKKIFTTITQ